MKTWNSQSVGKPWQHRFFYAVIRFTGPRGAYLCMYFIVLWYVLFYPPVHAKSAPYLSRRFPNRKTFVQRLLLEYRWITSLGRSLIDRATFGIRGPHSLQIDVPEGTALLELLNEGKGLIIVSAHTGCWQIAFSALRFLEKKVYIVMHQNQFDIDKHYFEYEGQKAPFEIIDPAGYLGGTLSMAAVLKEGGILGLMGDRIFGDDGNTVTLDFLGHPIRVPVAAYRLAAMQGTPIAVLLSHKSDGFRYRVELFRVIRVPAMINRNSDAYKLFAGEFIQCLTHFVQEHPFDFFNFYDMWQPAQVNSDERAGSAN